ncbi:hypothetical protein K435DRAFT_877115 [Dendrothele bispora CBS 962.96]|uniref:Uncharacterized protein n=1 Tax=Dendrothele bispora (strain CBS 962.96) TaxID=1314807 RepID=A0A4S8KRL8_DENBC|nr:hypothetical protein K435DRAFT_877115 [Dendrothele bispora CBS 962.96]
MLDEVEDGRIELEDSNKTLVQSKITVNLPKVYPAKTLFNPTLVQFVEKLQGKLDMEHEARTEMADLWVWAEENCRKMCQDWVLLLKQKRQIQKEWEDLKLELSTLKEENELLKGATEEDNPADDYTTEDENGRQKSRSPESPCFKEA